MKDEKSGTKDEELIIFDSIPIWKDGRILKDEREIVEYIDTHMKPDSLDELQNPEETWHLLRAHLMHMHLTTKEERTEAFQEAIESKADFGAWILKRMQEKYPDYW
jgi:hypothetical protein